MVPIAGVLGAERVLQGLGVVLRHFLYEQTFPKYVYDAVKLGALIEDAFRSLRPQFMLDDLSLVSVHK